MKIIYFHRKPSLANSIEENFKDFIAKMGENNDVEVFSMPYTGGNPINLWRNIRFIRKHSTKDGINHITGDIHYGILGLIGRKSVLTIHDDYAMRMAHRGPLDKLYKYIFWIWLPIKLASAAVCTNPFVLKSIQRYYNNKKLQVITHHHLPPIFSPKNKPFNKECPVLLQTGTAVNKNLETTIEVIKGMNVKLRVLKKMTDKQIELCKKYNIDFTNRYGLPFSEVVAEYDNADIVLFPTLFEGLGVPTIEAQAAGKPVITTNKEPMNWVAGPDGALLLDNPLDVEEYKSKLIQLINDESLRNRLITNGLNNIKRFSLENAIKLYWELYCKL
ncbi:glycosyltransferase [Bacteroides ilei]|uniref:glycosyltransferase n=1 Tax=Bacteroides ilei TaxID=1907658 RepID=UPI000930EFAA|nr:glycosyltransferase [Bacteroides ilei]